MTTTLSPRPTAHGNPVRTLKAGLFAALAAYATAAPAAAAAPVMGAVELTVFKQPPHGCPAHVQLFVSSYATGWPDGDTTTHEVTYTMERIKNDGSMVKYKSYTSTYKPLTMQNGKQTTELSTFDDGVAVGIDTQHGFHNRAKLIILKPFHWESDWQDITVNCE
jgi:hypothetical protein